MMIVRIDGVEFNVAGDTGEFSIDQDLIAEREDFDQSDAPEGWNEPTEFELDKWATEQERILEDVG
jgi:hypothetical protein